MATMLIAEYERLLQDQDGFPAQLPLGPPVAEQVISYSATHGESAALGPKTRIVRIVCDGIAHLAFGASAVATTSNATKVEARTPEYFGVAGGIVISAVTGS